MKGLAIIVAVLVALALVAWVGYRVFLPKAFVAAGRGGLDEARLVQVASTTSAQATLSFDGKTVDAGPEHKYVVIDLRIDAPAGRVDFDDFQLVKDKAAKLGEEENVGDNADRDYFFWSFLDSSGTPLSEVPTEQQPFGARVAFKVPRTASSGYLFYWGFYWGPLEFATQ